MEMKKSLKPHGWFPGVVYRSFDKREFAEQFIEEGRFRLCEIRDYNKIEDAFRRDITENTAHVKTIEPVVSVHFPTDGGEPFETIAVGEKSRTAAFDNKLIYILCCSLKVPTGKFGAYSVKILDPKALATDISTFLETLPWKVFGGVEGVRIEYTKGLFRDGVPDSVDMARLCYTQKPGEFADDEEFRFVTIHEWNENKKDLEVNLDKKLNYVEYVGE